MTQRNYRKEYDNYHSKPEQREKNAARLRARRLMVKKGKVKKNDKKDVHHLFIREKKFCHFFSRLFKRN